MTGKATQLSFPFEFARRLTPKRRAKEKAALYAKYMGIQEGTESPKPKVRRPRLSRRAAIHAFTPFEHAILSDLFKIPRLRIARDIDIWAAVDSEGKPLLNPELRAEYLIPELSLRNAAAQVILKTVEGRLPNYYSFRTKKRIRKPGIGTTGKPITLKAQHLLTIFWPSSPGFDWPEAYYLTYLPGYDRFVVTLSQDSRMVKKLGRGTSGQNN
jgi:hypothetical protein